VRLDAVRECQSVAGRANGSGYAARAVRLRSERLRPRLEAASDLPDEGQGHRGHTEVEDEVSRGNRHAGLGGQAGDELGKLAGERHEQGHADQGGAAFRSTRVPNSMAVSKTPQDLLLHRQAYSSEMAIFPNKRAFLLQLSDETDPEALVPEGRVEHIDSGVRGRFSSQDELWQFVRRVLEAEDGREDDPKTGG